MPATHDLITTREMQVLADYWQMQYGKHRDQANEAAQKSSYWNGRAREIDAITNETDDNG